MKKVITSGIVTTIVMLGMAAPAFAATTYQPMHATSTSKMVHATTTTPTVSPKATTTSKTVLLIGTVGQNTTGFLTVTVKTQTYNITVGSTAPILSKTGKTIALTAIKAGDQIRVRGLATGTQVTATSMRDLSL